MYTLKTTTEHAPRMHVLQPLSSGKKHERTQKGGGDKGSTLRIVQKSHSGEQLSAIKAPTRFLIQTKEDAKVILFEDVMYCVADSNYTKIYLRDGSKLMVCKTLKTIEAILCQPNFLRIHASNLINLNCIKRILKTQGYMVELQDKVLLDVSRSRRNELMQKMERL